MLKKNNTNRDSVDKNYAFKSNIIKKIKEHKKEVIITTVTVSLSIVAIYALRKGLVLKPQLKQVCTKNIERTKVFPVNKHIRNLPKGSKPSIKKIEIAASNGYKLKSNQTWVDTYNKMSA